MPRIEDLAIQEEIGNSLLGSEAEEQESEQPASEYLAHGDDLLSEAIEEQNSDVTRYGDSIQAERQERSQRAETGTEQAHQGREQRQAGSEAQETQQAQEPTLQEVQAGIEALDRTVEEQGLNDPQAARDFASDFCSAFGTDVWKSGVDVQGLGNTMAKVTLSAVNFYEGMKGAVTELPPIPEASARAFTHDLLRGMGFDPRAVNVDEKVLADTVFRGALNFLDTYTQLGGKVTDMSRLNSPEAAEWLFANWLRAFGIDRPVDRATAVKFADAGGKYILSFLGKLGQVQDRQAASQQQQPRGGRGRGQRVPARFREAVKGAKAPRFRTNAGPGEPFDNETMDAYQERSLRL